VRVLIDARSAAFAERTGVGRYTAALLERLPAVDPTTTYVAWYLHARRMLGESAPIPDVPGLRRRALPVPARAFDRLAAAGVPRLEWLSRFDVVFAPNFLPPPTRSPRVVLTVHDLAFRRFPSSAPAATRAWLEGLGEWLARASAVLAVSEATKRDLMELYGVEPERVRVTHLGVDRDVFRAAGAKDVAAVRDRLGIDGPYLLALGGLEPRKNLARLVEAWAMLPGDVRPGLVIGGSGVRWNPEGGAMLDRALDELPGELRSRVVLPGYVGGADTVALLSGALALAYPSTYEGFGLPVLEAMACGTPVVASNVSSLPEVAGDAAVLVDPLDPGSIAHGLERVLRDDALRRTLIAAGERRAGAFTWEDTARRTASVLREVGGEDAGRVRVSRRA
jgi:glycosyltransferase involved in cell wall biosynthesis